MEEMWSRINTYSKITDGGKAAWEKLARRKAYKKNEFFLTEGQIPRTVAFVSRGLFSHTSQPKTEM